MTEEQQLEEAADELLARYAKELHKSVRKIGILDKRTLRRIAKREIPMSLATKSREQEE